jgi:hypothetical protein
MAYALRRFWVRTLRRLWHTRIGKMISDGRMKMN